MFSFRKVERKIARQREAITQRNQARKEERQTKNEAIRVKYGKLFLFIFKIECLITRSSILKGLKPSTYSSLEE